MSIYREVLMSALRMTWRHKMLWVFGLFAALIGTGGAWETFFQNLTLVTEQPQRLNDLLLLHESGTLKLIADNVGTFFATPSSDKFLTLLFVAILFLFFFWITFLSIAAIIYSVGRSVKGKPATFTEAFSRGFHTFPHVLALNIIGKIMVWGLLIVVSVPLVALFLFRVGGVDVWDISLGVIAFIVLIPLAVIVTFLIQYAVAFVVIEDRRIMESVIAAWQLFKSNWLASLEMAFILYLINVIVGFFLFTIFLAPLQQLVLSYLGGTFTLLAPLLRLSVFFTFVALAVLSAILATFEFSAYTLFFLKLTEGKVISKLARIFTRFSARESAALKRSSKA